jgi:hypothetical protein
MSEEEAHKNARMIEKECFAAPDMLPFMKEPHGDDSSPFKLYAAKFSPMMLEVLTVTVKDETIVIDDTLFGISNPNVSTIGADGVRVVLRPTDQTRDII